MFPQKLKRLAGDYLEASHWLLMTFLFTTGAKILAFFCAFALNPQKFWEWLLKLIINTEYIVWIVSLAFLCVRELLRYSPRVFLPALTIVCAWFSIPELWADKTGGLSDKLIYGIPATLALVSLTVLQTIWDRREQVGSSNET